MILTRINPQGQSYQLSTDSTNADVTVVHTRGKVMTFPMTISEMQSCWFQWQMKSLRIQEAFPDLAPEFREFLMTGITPEEWNQIFSHIRETD